MNGLDTSDVADVKISLREHVLTRLFDVADNHGRDYFRASTVRLAFWFAENWWRLRWEPIDDARSPSPDWRLAHELSSGPGDEAWPPLMFYGVGDRVIVSPSNLRTIDDESVSYLLQKPLSIGAAEYEAGVDALLQSVLDRCAWHNDAVPLRALIDQLRTERYDEELAGWRRLEACLGFDPDRSPQDVISAMVAYEEILGERAIDEAAVAAPGIIAPHALHRALEAAEASAVTFRMDELLNRTPMGRSSQIPWQAAEDAAKSLRTALGLGERVYWHDLGDMLGVRWETLKTATATARQLPFGATLSTDARTSRAALQFDTAMDRRFEIARHIGDIIWTRETRLGVISRAKTDRQKFQRRFAQELLVPVEALRRFVNFSRPTEEQMAQAARFFWVRPTVVRALLMGKGVIAHETLADRLELA